MSPRTMTAIVEGDGEEHAVPALVGRWIAAHRLQGRLHMPAPAVNAKGVGRLKAPYDPKLHRGIEHYIGSALRGRTDAILVVLDADDECLRRPAGRGLAQELLERALPHAGGKPVAVVVAHREFEAWFLHYLDRLWSDGHFPDLAECPVPVAEVERRADCKKAVGRLTGLAYNPVVHQRILARGLPLELGPEEGPRSYRKLMKEVGRLAEKLIGGPV